MQVPELITLNRVAWNIEAGSKKRALEELGQLIALEQNTISSSEVFESLISRERLGSTGLGHGVAIPHGRIKNSERTLGAFIKLKNGIDFDAVDEQPVDLLFALLVPEQSTNEHLELLAQLAEMFSDEALRQKLRTAGDTESLYRLLNEWRSSR